MLDFRLEAALIAISATQADTGYGRRIPLWPLEPATFSAERFTRLREDNSRFALCENR